MTTFISWPLFLQFDNKEGIGIIIVVWGLIQRWKRRLRTIHFDFSFFQILVAVVVGNAKGGKVFSEIFQCKVCGKDLQKSVTFVDFVLTTKRFSRGLNNNLYDEQGNRNLALLWIWGHFYVSSDVHSVEIAEIYSHPIFAKIPWNRHCLLFSRNFFRVRVKFFNFHSVRVLYVFVCVCILCECVVLLVVRVV